MPKGKRIYNNNIPLARSGNSVPSAQPLGWWAGAAIIVAAVFLVYLPSMSGGFIFDDNHLLTDNEIIKDSDGLYRFWCTTDAEAYWPVTYTTLWIEWRLWGMNSTGYHITNLILHVAEALLIWAILRKLYIPGAFLAAVIFAVHPVNVESAAWISQRTNMMAMLFFLLSILWYLKADVQRSLHAQCDNSAHGVCGVRYGRWYWLSLAAFILAMLSKGSVAILPVLLLVLVWWQRPLTKWDLVRTVPFFIVAALLAGVNIWFQTHGSGAVIRTAGFTERLLGAGGVVWFYLYKALWPINLVFIYPQWHVETGNPLWWMPLLAALAVTAVLWLYRERWSRPLLFGWGFFCVALVPVMGFTDVSYMQYSLVADHYQHIAIVGVIALAAALWSVWHRRAREAGRYSAAVVAVVSVGMLAFMTWRQSGLYRNEIALYEETLKKNPDCWIVHNNLGAALVKTGRSQEAIEHYQQALRLNPNYPEAWNNMGITLFNSGRLQEAVEHYRRALQLKPDYPDAHNNLGIILAQTGRVQEAIEHYQQALRQKPDFVEAYYNLAFVYAIMHESSEVIATSRKALELAKLQGNKALAGQIEDLLNSCQEQGEKGEERGVTEGGRRRNEN